MPCEGYADPITNGGPGFPLNMPVSELADRVTRAIGTSDVSSTPSVAETLDRVTITKMNQPLDRTPAMRGGSRKVGLVRRLNMQS